jgi:DNA-binding winged helix-turn-helix (wHTH) protein
MEEPRKTADVVRFGPFELLLDTQELRKHGIPLKLSGQAIQVLAMLAANPGQLVTREELQKKLWPGDSFGDFEHGLNAAVNKLREKLGDSATTPTYIETLPGRGYRFIEKIESEEPKSSRIESEPPKPRWKLKAAVAVMLAAAIGGGLYWRAHRPLSRPLAHFGVDDYWEKDGSTPASYEAGLDTHTIYNGQLTACLRSKESVAGDYFGALSQFFPAGEYRGKRVRFGAFVKSEGVRDWAGLWMRVDNLQGSAAFDNMQDRPIKGTTGWQHYSVVLDVPLDATGLVYGVLLAGSGTIWLGSAKFEAVGTDVPTTSRAEGRLQ